MSNLRPISFAPGAVKSVATFGAALESERILRVLKVIALNGPIGLTEISRLSHLPRVSAWREVRVLCDEGWVRHRAGDRLYELSTDMDYLFSAAHTAAPETDDISRILLTCQQEKRLRIDVGLLSARGRFTVIERSHRKGCEHLSASLAFDAAPIAALSILPRAEADRIIDLFLADCSTQEAFEIRYGVFAERLDRARETGRVYVDGPIGVAVGIRFKTGACGAVLSEASILDKDGENKIRLFLETLDRTLSDIARSETSGDQSPSSASERSGDKR